MALTGWLSVSDRLVCLHRENEAWSQDKVVDQIELVERWSRSRQGGNFLNSIYRIGLRFLFQFYV